MELMNLLLQFFILIPIAGFIINLIIPSNNEGLLSKSAFFTVGLQLVCFILFTGYWIFLGHPVLNLKDIVLYKSNHHEFYIDFYFDKITVVYGLVGALLTFLVTIYSRYYLHRESGYKRFFNSILFFYLGYNLVIFSGNLETLFIGWEILGISSFLLIAFYRDRYLPVKNAVKVFSIYRIGDVGLIIAMWLCHDLWHENITFSKLNNYELVHEHLQNHTWVGIFISIMILVSAAAKSAQLPFSSWLPRAMEGPTPSSAIFYGSLSVHLGVFILLRTMPFWEHQLSVRIIIGLLGLFTSIIASGISRVQSSVKSQIAYSSISQIGLIFIEIALGYETLALIHFAGNAFLRTYQLLVSPSVVSYLIREQFFNFVPQPKVTVKSFRRKIMYSFYVLCLKEWNLDSFNYKYLWNPLKKIGKMLGFLNVKRVLYIFVPLFVLGVYCLYDEEYIPRNIHAMLPDFFSLIGLILVLKSFTERKNVMLAWLLIIMNHFWIALAISFNEHFTIEHTVLYLGGMVIAGLGGYTCLLILKSKERNIDLDRFQGHSYEHPIIAFLFLLCSLGLSGFPITPSFIGEDLIFSHIHDNQPALAIITSLSLLIDGIAVIRIYARIFMGTHIKTYHEIAYRSS